MKKRNVFINIFLISFVTVMILSAGIKDALAYFTTYARAEGGYFIRLGYETEIDEEFSNWKKTVRISNKSGSEPVYIRVKAFCGEEFDLNYSGSNWYLGDDGFWYYKNIVNGGSETEALSIKIENVPKEVAENTEFNVVVIYESTPVRYDKNGNPYADWTATLDSGSMKGGR